MIPTAYVARAATWMLLIALVGLSISLELTHRQQISAARTLEDSERRQQLLTQLSATFARAETAERGARVDHSSEAIQSYQIARAALDQYRALPTAVSASPDHSDAGTDTRVGQDIARLGDDDRTPSAITAARLSRLQTRSEILIAVRLLVSLALIATVALAMRERRVRALRSGPDRSLNRAGASDLATLSRQLQTMAEKEKAQLARSLHDELGGVLIAVKMDTSWLHKRWPNPTPEVQARWERVFKVLDEGVDFKRRVVENLRPTLLDNMGLIAAVRWVAQETCERAGLHCVESYPEHDPALSDDASILVFRLVQEALNNVVKHARATDVRIEMTSEPHELSVLVEDNGVGIDGRAAPSATLHGLTIMKVRVSSLGGTLEVGAAPHGGTLIRARLPTQHLPKTGSEAPTAVPDR
jgi:signal transduction histidine kinase